MTSRDRSSSLRVPFDLMRVVLRSIGLLLLTLACLAGLELALLFAPRGGRDSVVRAWMGRYGRRALRLLGGRVIASLPTGAPLKGSDARGVGRVFVMNHRSMLDIFVYLAFIEANALSRADLAQWLVIGHAARRVGTVFVDRSRKASGSHAVSVMAEALASGRGILVFPEGTTFRGDEVRPFRAGAFVAAERAGAEVVPVGIAYERDAAAYVDEPFLTHWKRLTSMPTTRAALEVGAPVRPMGDPDALRLECQNAVQRLVTSARSRGDELRWGSS